MQTLDGYSMNPEPGECKCRFGYCKCHPVCSNCGEEVSEVDSDGECEKCQEEWYCSNCATRLTWEEHNSRTDGMCFKCVED